MKSLAETAPFRGTESEKQAYLQGAEFTRVMILQKMRELLDDEFLSDGQVLDELYEFIKK